MKIPNMKQWVADAGKKFMRMYEQEKHKTYGWQAELGRKLAKAMRENENRAKINKILDGRQGVTAEEMYALSQITGHPPPNDSPERTAPLLGWVQAGKLSDPGEPVAIEDAKRVPIPENLPKGDYFVLEVEGRSMDELSPPGSLIVVDRKQREPITGSLYVFSVDGEANYKRWQAKPPALVPLSNDPDFKTRPVDRKKGLEVVGRVVLRILFD